MNTTNVATRRRFFWKAGAVISAPLAVGVAAAAPDTEDNKLLKARLARLTDINAIRELNQAFARHVNSGESDELKQLFADPGRAMFDASVRKLLPSGFGEQDLIEISADGQSARASICCAVQIETEIGPDCTLVEMARQQGDGVLRRTEERWLENEYIRQGGVWRIQRCAFRPG